VGAALAALRASRNLSMNALSRQSGVSKSMLSQIERGRANPTVAVVWRLANALGVPLASLLGAGAAPERGAVHKVPVPSVPVMRSVDRRCELQVLSPVELAGRMEWYHVTFRTGGVLKSKAHAAGALEHLTVIEGTVEARSGTETARAERGETLRYSADLPHELRCVGQRAALALLVVEFLSGKS
jgi:quercetin dioxygenase-like cupin family protein/DNA-binding XRE family transcriptional regulator